MIKLFPLSGRVKKMKRHEETAKRQTANDEDVISDSRTRNESKMPSDESNWYDETSIDNNDLKVAIFEVLLFCEIDNFHSSVIIFGSKRLNIEERRSVDTFQKYIN